MIKFIIDSTIDLSDDLLKTYDVDMISLQVLIDGKNYRDRKEIKIEDLYQAIKENKKVQTSLPIMMDMYETFEKYAKENTDFIFYTFSSRLSGTYNAGRQVIEDLKGQYPNVNMIAIDSKNGGTPGLIMALDILEKIKSGASFNEVVDYANMLTTKMENLFLVNDLTQLKRGGRISTLKSLVGNLLNIKPILILDDGAITQYKSSIGQKRALNDMIEFVVKNIPNKNALIGINYSANEELLHKVEGMLIEKGFNNFIKSRIASTMTAHIGLDAISLSFYKA
ncbi:DegV family protein [Acholeplasma hippikon]|uniref:EDD domain-containing protein, DegV family n=1 Tax=Acholeplasma hippikon TaxID=264636 RepID=A0A449BLE6_9MOLU|nr:DegV family protein [Acholeplasma hippikon]VEU83253.1 EDD domain-containing protein, DegV family [Acholeplasma hippikon]